MTRFKTMTALMLAVLVLAAVLAACGGNDSDKLTRLEGKAPYYTSVEDALAAVTGDQYVVVDFYTDW